MSNKIYRISSAGGAVSGSCGVRIGRGSGGGATLDEIDKLI